LLKEKKLNVRKAIKPYFPETIIEKHKEIWDDKTI